MSLKEQLISLFEKLLENKYELVSLEIFKDNKHGSRIQVMIDRLDGQYITADDCGTVTHMTKEALYNAVPDDYIFEVSSPGLNRPLRKPEHFIRFIGQCIRFKCDDEKREEIIKNANNEGIELATGENISYQRIKDAKLQFKMKAGEKK